MGVDIYSCCKTTVDNNNSKNPIEVDLGNRETLCNINHK